MTGRQVVAIVVVLAFYLTLVGPRATLLLQADAPTSRLVGLAVLMLPLGAVGYLWREARLSRATQRIVDDLPETKRDDFPVSTAGTNADPERAAMVVAANRLQAERTPTDWVAWYRLAQAYNALGDHRQGRAALRQAIDLHAKTR